MGEAKRRAPLPRFGDAVDALAPGEQQRVADASHFMMGCCQEIAAHYGRAAMINALLTCFINLGLANLGEEEVEQSLRSMLRNLPEMARIHRLGRAAGSA